MEPASSEFDNLFLPAHGYSNYYDLVQSIPQAIPVLRLGATGVENLADQIERINEIDRGVMLRVVFGETFNPLALVGDVLPELSDPVVMVDAQWSRELLLREGWATDLVRRTWDVAAGAEVIVTGTSFPEAFANIESRKVFDIEERGFHSSVQRHFNEAIKYGDWGSTRPPREGGGLGKRRIDLPQSQTWVIFRQDGEETYQQLAERVRSSSEWPSQLNIWGTYAINSTAEGLPGAIRGQEAAASARINIHLHRQALFGMPGEVGDAEEPFTDT